MTLVKLMPKKTILNDFDNMISDIFNEGLKLETNNNINIPLVDISENQNQYSLLIDFPGYDKKDININIFENILTVSINNKNADKNATYMLREREKTASERSFELPENILVDKVSAKYKNGTLNISVPKKEKVKSDIYKIKIS